MNMQDCYASYEKQTGCLKIGNSRIEKQVQVRGSRICTDCILDRESGAEWKSEKEKLWQRCPVLMPEESPEISVQQEITAETAADPALKVTLRLAGQNGTVWYEYRVFPEIPFVFSQIFVESLGKTAENSGKSPEEQYNGIESQKSGGREDVFCGSDVLDCIPLGDRHLELETVTLYDKTDGNDALVQRSCVPVYRNGCCETEGNIFRITDYPRGRSLLLVKHAPTPSSALHRMQKDLRIFRSRYAELRGSGIDFSALPAGKVPYYASAVGTAGTENIWHELRRYGMACCRGSGDRELTVMSNTWGDRSQDMAVCEEFILRELETAHRLGISAVQIDDGWQNGVTANALRKKHGVWEGFYQNDPDFWTVNLQRFPRGLGPIVEKAREYGIQIGLWFGPDSSGEFENAERDIETLWNFYQKYGIRWFKLDGIKIRSKLCEMRLIHILRELNLRSAGEIRFNLDITAEDRFGYLYEIQYGTLFVENRYTDWGNYYPHNTFRNLWCLAEFFPARNFQMEFLNCRRNPEQYEGMPFAPALYRMDYLFATVLPSNPLAWMELQHLEEADVQTLKAILEPYRRYRRELFDAEVIPIGCMPNGMAFSGYFCKNADGKSAHLLLFRESTAESSWTFALPDSLEQMKAEEIYASAPVQFAVSGYSISADFAEQRSVLWLRAAAE